MNAVQSTAADKSSKGKKKGKAKEKSDQPKQNPPKPPSEEGAKRKPKYPCLICEEDHYTKDCPRRSEVSRLLKGASGSPAVLKEPFPSQQTHQVADPSQSSSSFGSQVFMVGTTPSMFQLERKIIHLVPGKSRRFPPALLRLVLVLSTSKGPALRRFPDPLQKVYSGSHLTTLMLMLPNTIALLRT